MQRVEACGHLHGLHLINGVACGVECSTQFQWRTAIGVVVFDYEILHLLGVHERCRERVLLSLDVVVILEAVSRKHLLHLDVWARSNLVNH